MRAVTAWVSWSVNAVRSAAEANRTSTARAKAATGDQVGSGTFADVSLVPFLGEPDQPVPFEFLEVVVGSLPGEAQEDGWHGGRARLGQGSEDPGPYRVQGRLGRGGFFDHSDVQHRSTVQPEWKRATTGDAVPLLAPTDTADRAAAHATTAASSGMYAAAVTGGSGAPE